MTRPRCARLRPIAAAVVLVGLVSACAPSVDLPRGLADPTAADADDGVCGLLAVEEVEVAVNRPLADTAAGDDARGDGGVPTPVAAAPETASSAGTAGSPGALLPGMTMCALGAPPAGAAWGVVADEPARRYRRYVRWHADYVEPTTVAGHEAVWDAALATLLVRTDDVVFGLTLTVADPPLAAGETEGDYRRGRAVELARRALRRR